MDKVLHLSSDNAGLNPAGGFFFFNQSGAWMKDLIWICSTINPLDTNIKFDAYVPTRGPFGWTPLVYSDNANFRPQNKA